MKETINAINLKAELKRLKQLLEKISHKNVVQKLTALNLMPEVQHFLEKEARLKAWLKHRTLEEDLVIKSVLAIGQGPILFKNFESVSENQLENLLSDLIQIEKVYNVLGGIIGYQYHVLALIVAKEDKPTTVPEGTHYYQPVGADFSKEAIETKQAARWGIEAMPQIAEIYPVGGAGDRLDLQDEQTHEALPAAELRFCGRTLLEGLIRDLQAREYLYYKLMGSQVVTPIAMMTSKEKNNHDHILRICQEHGWFGRPKNMIRLFMQPQVPVVTIHGEWVVQNGLQLMVKPGGHGMIWKLALDEGIIDWLIHSGIKEVLVRQINNPIAGTDNGLSAFTGWGHHHEKMFGFSSCPRRLNATEGMDVLIETEGQEGYEYKISNIEYTEFESKGVQDVAETPGSPYSKYPANTNILFANLHHLHSLIPQHPIPGMLINMKSNVTKNEHESVPAGRLESTMQNIADAIVDRYPQRLDTLSPAYFKTYLTYNKRRKTISVTKRSYSSEKTIHETPEGSFYEMLQNHEELLREYCGIELPELGTEEEYLKMGPGFIALFHPALGPFYSIIAQKIRGGHFTAGSELQLEISEIDVENLFLSGSLLIKAENLVGHKEESEIIHYSENTGKCTLRNVKVSNKGIDRSAKNKYWKNQIQRHEYAQIILKGNAELYAENTTLEGLQDILVPDGYRLILDKQVSHLEKLKQPSWYWHYSFDSHHNVLLRKKIKT